MGGVRLEVVGVARHDFCTGVSVGLLLKGAARGSPPVFALEDKFRLVLAVISGEMTTGEAARRGKTSEQSITNWKRQFFRRGQRTCNDSTHRYARSARSGSTAKTLRSTKTTVANQPLVDLITDHGERNVEQRRPAQHPRRRPQLRPLTRRELACKTAALITMATVA